MPRHKSICITVPPGELQEGLFGGVLVYLFEVLPYLERRGIFPNWSIASRLYGEDPDCVVVPGVLDLAYTPEPGPQTAVPLAAIRHRHKAALGSDWPTLHALWSAYFRVPPRLTAMAEAQGDLTHTLGLHYRGGDKKTAFWDTNPVSQDDFIAIVQDFLKRPHHFTRIFAPTDEPSFLDRLQESTNLPVFNLGKPRFHKDLDGQPGRAAEADAAMLDCLILSRCGAVLSTSSALSGFAKVLNPELEIYRSAASKRFMEVPYFRSPKSPNINPRIPKSRRSSSARCRTTGPGPSHPAPSCANFSISPGAYGRPRPGASSKRSNRSSKLSNMTNMII